MGRRPMVLDDLGMCVTERAYLGRLLADEVLSWQEDDTKSKRVGWRRHRNRWVGSQRREAEGVEGFWKRTWEWE